MRLLREPTDTAEGGDPLLLLLDVLLAVLEPLDPKDQQCRFCSRKFKHSFKPKLPKNDAQERHGQSGTTGSPSHGVLHKIAWILTRKHREHRGLGRLGREGLHVADQGHELRLVAATHT